MNRRRLLSVLPTAILSPSCRRPDSERLWKGIVFNSPVSIRYQGPRELPATVFARIRKLESIFSLYQPDSELALLNQNGLAKNPTPELVALLKRCQHFHQISQGVFDPSIQTYWKWLRDRNQEGSIPDESERKAQLSKVDFSRVSVTEAQISLRGTQLTLNAIAQGFLTDQITALLQTSGIESALVNLGEFRAFGKNYPIAIRHPSVPQNVLTTIQLQNQSIAVSSGSGHRLTATGRDNHLLSPSSGQSPPARKTIAVLAPDATTADAWATILALNPELAKILPPSVSLVYNQ